MMAEPPIVTIAVPCYNQSCFLEQPLASIFEQDLPVEVFVADGGSTNGSVDIIRRYEGRLAGWRSYSDRGQAAAINECIALGKAPYVCCPHLSSHHR
jgi:glycosyltransferase involved in cell wall biosynthesis